MSTSHTVVGLGEILWDLLPSGKRIGGAPANFAYCSHLLGENAIVVSRVGNDLFGREIREELAKFGVSDQFVQADALHPTGMVQVRLDSAGQPTFEFVQPVAWDFLEWTPELQTLSSGVDAVCFGSLAQRAEQSRNTILKFVDGTKPGALRTFDVNLRQNFYSKDILIESLKRANVVKLNHEEVPRVADVLEMDNSTDASFCRALIERFDLKLVCITRGDRGSLLCDKTAAHEHHGFRVKVKDTIGSGDAFTAALVHGILQKSSLAEMNHSANRLGAWVASHSGAMPRVSDSGLEQELMKIAPSRPITRPDEM
jgi:fructokinase